MRLQPRASNKRDVEEVLQMIKGLHLQGCKLASRHIPEAMAEFSFLVTAQKRRFRGIGIVHPLVEEKIFLNDFL